MNYSQYLNSFHWRDLRDAKLHSVNDRCEKCHRRSNLQVHHLTYERLGHERLTDLQVLCESCHEKAHNLFPTVEDDCTPPEKQKKRRKCSPPSIFNNAASKKKRS
jgi:5-methylcytosine-specific restriction endonuclease McrA